METKCPCDPKDIKCQRQHYGCNNANRLKDGIQQNHNNKQTSGLKVLNMTGNSKNTNHIKPMVNLGCLG